MKKEAERFHRANSVDTLPNELSKIDNEIVSFLIQSFYDLKKYKALVEEKNQEEMLENYKDQWL